MFFYPSKLEHFNPYKFGYSTAWRTAFFFLFSKLNFFFLEVTSEFPSRENTIRHVWPFSVVINVIRYENQIEWIQCGRAAIKIDKLKN